ncbi:MAG: hypothetical protein J6N55_10980 [Anaerovibrio sp.]|uniref:P-loop NTPase fold protein n=1 Tax=Anaerovibrio sp. TaxID=1872532 RepID=UPI001B0DFE54|nr:P-loop NTPase fold protein [Anaerovibrio sp.]MBO6246785.1 hypothetical protein [Anaerovibrio sp.]
MKYLSNEPIGEDLFSSQAQNKIADVIRSNISDLQMIGIDGPWGTGKSNLVKILEKSYLKIVRQNIIFSYMIHGHIKRITRKGL